MTDEKPTAAEQFAAFFAAGLPARDLNALFGQQDPNPDEEENTE